MARLTVSQLRQMVAELLNLAPVIERYKALEKEVKIGMVKLSQDEIDVAGKGRVFIKQTERMTVSPALASEVLGVDLGRKVIVTKESVSNEIIDAFVKAGDISEELHQELQDRADRKEVINLYVRAVEMKKPTESKTIKFAAMTPFLLAAIFALLQGLTNELGLSLTEKQLWELVGVFLSGCALAAQFIRLRFLTKTGVSWTNGDDDQ